MNTLEYIIRTFLIVVSTSLRGCAFLIHRLFGGRANVTYPHVISWCTNVLWLAGIRLKVEGLENLDPNSCYIFISNHSSLFDIPVLQVALNRKVRIMYKKELQKVPFMGWALRYSSFVPIIREKARDAMSTVQRTVDAIRSDDSSLIVFAEGTRTSDGQLQKFKRGAFVMAIKSEMPIVPVSVIGTFAVLPKTTFRFQKGTVHVRIGMPIAIEKREYTRAEEVQLMERVHSQIQSMLVARI